MGILKAKFGILNDLPIYSTAWSGHLLFGYDLVKNIRPETLVELGSHRGHSTFSFAQAVKDNKLNTKIHAIDSWEGDKHAGNYGEEIFLGFKNLSNKFYKNIDIITHKMLFDNAVKEFEDNSIDILHIDGLHTYEAVKHDFKTWLPKVKKDTGIIMFHDIAEKRKDFGVYRLWDELKRKYSNIEFQHSHGLGVIFLNKEDNPLNFNTQKFLKRHYYLLSIKLFFEKTITVLLKQLMEKQKIQFNSLKLRRKN